MEIRNLSKQSSVLNQYVAEIRDINVHGDALRFRRNIERIGELMAYEISKTLGYEQREVQTPLAKTSCEYIKDDIILATVLRAGIPFHQGFLQIFDKAGSAFISAYRKYRSDHSSFEIQVEYLSSPSLDGKTLLLVDPMLATGSSLELAYKALLSKGTPAKVHVATVISSKAGVNAVKKTFSEDNVTLWTAAIDPDLNEHAYIVPGIGDAGDLAYGTKL
jgi:Uracil phosphoribosyltransferase